MKILMVCLGNICRSPMAAGILQHKANEAGLPWLVQSAGTGNWHMGQPAHELSQKVCKNAGIDITKHRARRLVTQDFTNFDHLFFMDNQNLADSKQIAGPLWQANKASLILNVIFRGADKNVPDPYYGDEKDFTHVFQLLDNACNAIIAGQTAHKIFQ